MKTYLFADGQKRAFKAELIAELVEPAEPPKDEDRERLSRGLNAGGNATPKAINLELEKQILASPEDPAPYLVYADWLQQRDDPRGVLIPIQADLLRDPNSRKLRDAERKLLEAHGSYLLPSSLYTLLRLPNRDRDPRTHCQAIWKLGFLEAVHLAKRPRQEGEIAPVVEELLRHPSAHFLRKLSIGSLGSTDEFNYITSIAAIARARHPLLRELVIGDFDEKIMDLSFSRVGTASPLFSAKATPALERLTLRAGNVRFTSHVQHPKLKALHLITSEFAETNLQHVLAGSMPELETLEISSTGLTIINPHLALGRFRKNHPKLRTLALRTTSDTFALLEGIVLSGLVSQLTHLELDGGDLQDAQVPKIEKLKKDLAALRALTLSGAKLTPAGAKRLTKIGEGVQATAQTRRIALTEENVVARAPDATSAQSARALANPKKWLIVGRDTKDRNRLWGEIEGRDHYYVLVNVVDRDETSCTCASPKDPCKHALALLFLAASQYDFEDRAIPDQLLRQSRDRPEYRSYWDWD
jgi:uncharacterized protein (TIGR02996 family)